MVSGEAVGGGLAGGWFSALPDRRIGRVAFR